MLLTDSGHYMLPSVSDRQADYCYHISADIQGRFQALVSALTVFATTGGAPNGTCATPSCSGTGVKSTVVSIKSVTPQVKSNQSKSHQSLNLNNLLSRTSPTVQNPRHSLSLLSHRAHPLLNPLRSPTAALGMESLSEDFITKEVFVTRKIRRRKL